MSGDKHGDDLKRFLTFSLAKENFGIPLLSVREVIAMPEVTPMPHTPTYFLGIMNLRGQIISVVDLMSCPRRGDLKEVETEVIFFQVFGPASRIVFS